MLNSVNQKPYLVRDQRSLVKKKQDEDASKSAAQTQREEQANQNARSKGLQYVEQQRQNPQYVDTYSHQAQSGRFPAGQHFPGEPVQTPQQAATQAYLAGKSPDINIAQIIKDFKNTASAIGTPQEVMDEVNGYIDLIDTQVRKENPNGKLIKSNLKNASTILDKFISETLEKESKVVENWVDALFLQNIDFKYNEESVNEQFLVKFPEGTSQAAETAQEKAAVEEPQPAPTVDKYGIPLDDDLKSMFIQSKKLAYANEPKKAILAFQRALQRADEIGDTETQSKIFLEIGKIYDDYDYVAHALKSYHKSVETTSDNNVKTKAHYSMAKIYDDVNQVTPALDHYFVSVSYAGEAENLPAQSTSLTKIGNIYAEMYEKDAFDFLTTADEIADETDNSKVKGYVSSSLAQAYDKFGEPEEALKSYSKAVLNYSKAESPLKTAQNYKQAAEIMIGFDSPNKARNLLEKALKQARKTDDLNLVNEISRMITKLD